ncbi:hypothetical protein CLV24_10274 [Pontibacter ummariensis]|uniref:Oxygen tolerance n=1 Tax=Pontibacter ummariensis TaxID=1610492 RepID=A0A239C5U1_9BACT|nr:hypothetical protein [Pontibacter ummariensis]PRY15453.1 hypothetical protein CLV24_10274 [Pontibacter ummariensis]SNS15001.1 hypothetical protein SAMN06296052_102339 [Pontibacter ummariensis]
MRNLILFTLLCLYPSALWAQQIALPSGTFNRDTVKLGEPLKYLLVHRHPDTQEVVLPSGKNNFAPFELVSRDFYPTKTKGGISTDSAVYTLRTFETQAVQQLSLPVYVLRQSDTLQVFAPSARVHLQQLVQQVEEPLPVKSETELAPVEERFNWPYVLLWVVAVITFLSLVWLLFGQAIRRKYKLYRLRKDHLYFASRYGSHVDRFVKSGATGSIEKAVSLWKNYLTKLERSAINSFTTKEIVEFYENDEEVNTALRICDKAIYGNMQTESEGETNLALGMLRRFAKVRYKTRREQINNAKNRQ